MFVGMVPVGASRMILRQLIPEALVLAIRRVPANLQGDVVSAIWIDMQTVRMQVGYLESMGPIMPHPPRVRYFRQVIHQINQQSIARFYSQRRTNYRIVVTHQADWILAVCRQGGKVLVVYCEWNSEFPAVFIRRSYFWWGNPQGGAL